MNNEINQICQKIDSDAILRKKFYRVWFFTNERANKFLQNLAYETTIKKVFAIGGGGDFAFNLLSLLDIDELNICDIRQMANLTVDLKIAILKRFALSETLSLLSDRKSNNKKQAYQKIRKDLTPISKSILDVIVNASNHANFLKCLKESGFWYKYSFRQLKHKKDYLLHLTARGKYQLLQKRIHKINIYCGDFIDNLQLFKNNYYELIYVSNMFDHKKYSRNNVLYLETIREKLKENGLLFVVTQRNHKKIRRLVEKFGLEMYNKELHRLNMLSDILGHYCYSFLLFRKK